MKKILLTFFIFFLFFLLFFSSYVSAVCSSDPTTQPIDESVGGTKGLVPCGNVQCCRLWHVFILLNNVYTFVWKFLVAPLAVLMLTIGGVLILISAGNPNLAGLGKRIIWVSIIGLALVFCSWLIISFILGAMGYKESWGPWYKSPF